MKKVLSVVLAAAMVLGMSVSAFAAAEVTFGGTTSNPAKEITNEDGESNTTFTEVTIVRDEKAVKTVGANVNVKDLESGDELYFPVKYGTGWADFKQPKNWVIKASSNAYIEDAEFFWDDEVNFKKDDTTLVAANTLFVKITLGDIDDFTSSSVNVYFYIYDKTNKEKSQRVEVKYKSGVNEETLYEDDLDWVITVSKPTIFTYDEDAKAKVATFNYDGVDAYYSVKLYPDDEYNVSASVEYNKALSKEYDTDVEVITLTGDFARNGELVLKSSKDNKQVVMVEDDELVPVEAEYVKNHKFANGSKVNGYVVKTADLGSYALIDADVEIEVEEDTTTAPSTPSTDKTNPSTGANDFVGAAVALAVVSVAAAGALAFKK